MTHIVSLTQLPVGQRLRLVRVEGGLGLRRRLLSLGVHIGGEMKLVHRHGGRVVLARGFADGARLGGSDGCSLGI